MSAKNGRLIPPKHYSRLSAEIRHLLNEVEAALIAPHTFHGSFVFFNHSTSSFSTNSWMTSGFPAERSFS